LLYRRISDDIKKLDEFIMNRNYIDSVTAELQLQITYDYVKI